MPRSPRKKDAQKNTIDTYFKQAGTSTDLGVVIDRSGPGGEAHMPKSHKRIKVRGRFVLEHANVGRYAYVT